MICMPLTIEYLLTQYYCQSSVFQDKKVVFFSKGLFKENLATNLSSGVKCWAKKAREDRIKLGVTIHRGLIWNIHARENFAWHMVEKEKGVKQRKTERGKLLIQTFSKAAR